ncbi:MAG: hypothetical protein HYS32_02375 [Candidatus Woesearchaeota archaeon]|nr:MAG: hypothetical protein HYS32_02375 [Candidatus Woesearchaeota archaeon]
MYVYYDEEGDFLELHIGEYSEGHFKNLGDGLFERVDKKTGEIKGIAIASFKKKTEQLDDVGFSLPVNLEITS